VDNVLNIAAQFRLASGTVAAVKPYGTGNINDTYLVTVDGGAQRRFILQRINQRVFPYPKLIMVNLRAFSEHIAAKRGDRPADAEARWELPQVVPTHDGQDYVIDEAGEFWRAITFIEGTRAYPKVRDAQHAREAGYALGRFQQLISDMDVADLHDTLPGFHILPSYLAHYQEVLDTGPERLTESDAHVCASFIDAHRDHALVLEQARDRGALRVRPIHGDPKIDNIMIDVRTGRAVSIVDLDTVKPGLVQYDIGDCLRSSCNPLGEETHEFDDVAFNLDLAEMILRGYLPQVEAFFADTDYTMIYDALWCLAFEMGLRFFTDYLEGDVYFKVSYPRNNLMRARVQFTLAESIAAQKREIRALVDTLRRGR
jgi:hypothetical protein